MWGHRPGASGRWARVDDAQGIRDRPPWLLIGNGRRKSVMAAGLLGLASSTRLRYDEYPEKTAKAPWQRSSPRFASRPQQREAVAGASAALRAARAARENAEASESPEAVSAGAGAVSIRARALSVRSGALSGRTRPGRFTAARATPAGAAGSGPAVDPETSSHDFQFAQPAGPAERPARGCASRGYFGRAATHDRPPERCRRSGAGSRGGRRAAAPSGRR